MNLSDYKKLYDAILEMSFDMDAIGLFENATEEDTEKCKWIAAMLDVFDDIPRSRMECMFKYKEIEFDYMEFMGY